MNSRRIRLFSCLQRTYRPECVDPVPIRFAPFNYYIFDALAGPIGARVLSVYIWQGSELVVVGWVEPAQAWHPDRPLVLAPARAHAAVLRALAVDAHSVSPQTMHSGVLSNSQTCSVPS